jgi:predicted transcriptional regulator
VSDPTQKGDQTPLPSNGWEQHELEQLRRLAKLWISEKLEWLEQAQTIAERLRKGYEDRPKSQD